MYYIASTHLSIEILRATYKDEKITFVEEKIAEWIRRGGDRIKSAAAALQRREAREAR